MMFSDNEIHILDTLSDGNFTIKELYLNIVSGELTSNEFFNDLSRLNEKHLISARTYTDGQLGEDLDVHSIKHLIDRASEAAESDWRNMPSFELNPSQTGYALLREKGLGHPD